jgi:hypothetical protein
VGIGLFVRSLHWGMGRRILYGGYQGSIVTPQE